MQPPPRGCVLKLLVQLTQEKASEAAASARLCVETLSLAKPRKEAKCSRLRAAVC